MVRSVTLVAIVSIDVNNNGGSGLGGSSGLGSSLGEASNTGGAAVDAATDTTAAADDEDDDDDKTSGGGLSVRQGAGDANLAFVCRAGAGGSGLGAIRVGDSHGLLRKVAAVVALAVVVFSADGAIRKSLGGADDRGLVGANLGLAVVALALGVSGADGAVALFGARVGG